MLNLAIQQTTWYFVVWNQTVEVHGAFLIQELAKLGRQNMSYRKKKIWWQKMLWIERVNFVTLSPWIRKHWRNTSVTIKQGRKMNIFKTIDRKYFFHLRTWPTHQAPTPSLSAAVAAFALWTPPGWWRRLSGILSTCVATWALKPFLCCFCFSSPLNVHYISFSFLLLLLSCNSYVNPIHNKYEITPPLSYNW